MRNARDSLIKMRLPFISWTRDRPNECFGGELQRVAGPREAGWWNEEAFSAQEAKPAGDRSLENGQVRGAGQCSGTK